MTLPAALIGSSRLTARIHRKKSRNSRRELPVQRRVGVLRAQTPKDIAVELKKLRGSELNLTMENSEQVVQDVMGIVQTMLQEGEEVSFRGFGKFYVSSLTGERQYRNPRTGEMITKNHVVSVRFAPSSKLKAAVKEAHVADGE
eukprot:g184.t1